MSPRLMPGAGAGAATIPDVFPLDGTYGTAFNGATDAIRSNGIENDTGGPFLVSGGFNWMSNGGPLGIVNAAGADYPASPGADQGAGQAFLYLPGFYKKLYFRWAFKKTTNSGDFWKLLRYRDQNNHVVCTPGLQATANNLSSHFDAWSYGVVVDTGVAITNNVWHWLEHLIDLTDPAAVRSAWWLDGSTNPVFDASYDYSAATPVGSNLSVADTQLHYLSINGTINKPLNAGNESISMVGVSTQKMGIPPGF